MIKINTVSCIKKGLSMMLQQKDHDDKATLQASEYYYDTASSDYAIWCNAGYLGTRVGAGDLACEFFVDN